MKKIEQLAWARYGMLLEQLEKMRSEWDGKDEEKEKEIEQAEDEAMILYDDLTEIVGE